MTARGQGGFDSVQAARRPARRMKRLEELRKGLPERLMEERTLSSGQLIPLPDACSDYRCFFTGFLSILPDTNPAEFPGQ